MTALWQPLSASPPNSWMFLGCPFPFRVFQLLPKAYLVGDESQFSSISNFTLGMDFLDMASDRVERDVKAFGYFTIGHPQA